MAFQKLFGFSTVNNINSANEYDADTDELIATITYTYEYNGSNFPTSLERFYESAGGGFSQTTRYEYTYY